MIVLNGDARLEEVSLAKTYFASQTRKLELAEKEIENKKRLEAREKFRQSGGKPKLEGELVANSKTTRKSLIERGIVPEELEAEEDLKKIEKKRNKKLINVNEPAEEVVKYLNKSTKK